LATLQDRARPPAPARYDAVVEGHLTRARRRIRTLDATAGCLGLLAGTMAYVLALVLLDRWLVLSPVARQLALGGYLLAALLYIVFGLVLPLTRRINPYFAARHLEEVVPEAKNSVVNWLDLHGQPLPPAIRGAVGQRAARDVARADLERAISGRRAAWLGGITTALFLALLVAMAVLGARPFFSLFGRALVPFREGMILTRTQLTLLEPQGGDATVPVGRSVHFAVDVSGRVPEPGKPDSLKLLFHYQQGDPFEERALEREEDSRWGTTLPAFQVQNGFWYKVTGGDAETAEYRVQVRATPLIERFDVNYHFRPYFARTDLATNDPNLRAHRGTELTLTAHTNRTVRPRDSRLEIELAEKGPGPKPTGEVGPADRAVASPQTEPVKTRKPVAAEPVPDDPQALRFRFVLDEDGKYHIWFTSTDGEQNTNPTGYSIQALRDYAPQVELKQPGEDVTLPANDLLRLEGFASDDIGVKSLTLRMRVVDGPVLHARPYREGKSFQMEDKGYPKTLYYKDFVELAGVKDEGGKPVALRPKMVLEYWLEAADACDYPDPNVARTKSYKVTIAEPDADAKKQEKEREQAKEEQKKHDAKQDEQLKQEEQQRKEEAKQDRENNQQKQDNPNDKKEQSRPQQGNKPDDKQQQDKSQQGNKPDDKPKEQKPDQKPDKQDGDGGKKDEKQQQAEKLANAAKDEQRGQSKDQPKDSKGEKKDEGKQEQKPNPGQCKGCKDSNGQEQSKPDAGQGKGAGSKSGEQKPDAGQNKDGGQGADKQDKGTSKDQPGGKPDAAQNKDGGQGQSQSAKGEQKGPQQGAPKPDAGQGKDGGAAQPGMQQPDTGQAKAGPPESTGNDKQSAGAAKAEPQSAPEGQSKDGGSNAAGNQELTGMGKDEGKPAGGAEDKKGQDKPAPQQKEGSGVAKAQPKEGETQQGSGQGDADRQETRDAKPKDVERLTQQMNGDDAKKGAEAFRKLQEVSQQAKDPAARDAAHKSLDNLARDLEKTSQEGKDPQTRAAATKALDDLKKSAAESSPSAAKEGPKDQGPSSPQNGPPCAQCKGGPGGQKPGGGKPGGTNPGQGNPPQGEAKEGGNKTAEGGPSSAGQDKDGGGGRSGAQTHGGGGQPGDNTTPSAVQEDPQHDGPPDAKQQAAGDLILENLRKTLEELKKHPEELQKVLNRAGMDEKQLRDVEQYIEEKLPPPQQGGSLTNIGARPVASGQGKDVEVKVGPRGQPPPGYRTTVPEFTRKLAEPEDK
jgi:hypothetical protein